MYILKFKFKLLPWAETSIFNFILFRNHKLALIEI